MKKGAFAAFLWLSTLVLFWQASDHGFFYLDDPAHIIKNPYVNPPSWDGLRHLWTEGTNELYIPMTYTVWSAETVLASQPQGRPNARVYHVGNLLLHATNSVLVFFVLCSLMPGADLAAWLGAFCFAFHPVQVEPVVWVSGLKDLLSAFFALIASLLYLRFPRRGYAGALICFLLAILSKPAIVALPVLLGASEIGILGRPWKGALLRLLPWFLPAAGIIYYTHSLQPVELSLAALSIGQRVRIALDSLGFYGVKYLFPSPLLLDYGRSPNVALRSGGLLCALPIAFLVCAAVSKKRRFWLSVFLIYLGGGMVTTLGLVPFLFQFFSTVSDRYSYLSLLALGLVVTYLTARFHRSWAPLAVGVAALAVVSFFQVRHWKDSETFLRYTLQHNPKSALVYGLLGIEKIREGAVDQGVEQVETGLRLSPEWTYLRHTLAETLFSRKQYDEAESHYKELRQQMRDDEGLLWEIAQKELAAGRPAQAIDPLKCMSRGLPQSRVWNALAVAYFDSGRQEQALRTFAEGARLFPGNLDLYLNWANALERAGRTRDALGVYSKLSESRTDEEGRRRWAQLLGTLGHWGEAAEQYRKILLFSGASPLRLVWRADALMQTGRRENFQDAIDAYEEALELDGGFQPAREGLARARSGKKALPFPVAKNEWADIPTSPSG